MSSHASLVSSAREKFLGLKLREYAQYDRVVERRGCVDHSKSWSEEDRAWFALQPPLYKRYKKLPNRGHVVEKKLEKPNEDLVEKKLKKLKDEHEEGVVVKNPIIHEDDRMEKIWQPPMHKRYKKLRNRGRVVEKKLEKPNEDLVEKKLEKPKDEHEEGVVVKDPIIHEDDRVEKIWWSEHDRAWFALFPPSSKRYKELCEEHLVEKKLQKPNEDLVENNPKDEHEEDMVKKKLDKPKDDKDEEGIYI